MACALAPLTHHTHVSKEGDKRENGHIHNFSRGLGNVAKSCISRNWSFVKVDPVHQAEHSINIRPVHHSAAAI